MHENELIQALREGSERAYAELVRIHGSRIYNTALGLLQQAEEAEEVAQDVLVAVYRTIGAFRGDSGLATWLYRITVSRSLDVLRRRKRKRLLAFTRVNEKTEAADFHHPGVQAEQKENAAALFRALRRLPAQQQAAFVLRKLEGLGQNEIAMILDTTVPAVESLLQRARTGLYKTLEKQYKNYQ